MSSHRLLERADVLFLMTTTHDVFCPFHSTEVCASVFHRGGARLILCGKSWEKLEELAGDLADSSDPSVVSPLAG